MSTSSAIDIKKPSSPSDDAFGFGTSGSSVSRRHFLSTSPLKSPGNSGATNTGQRDAINYLRSLKAVRERSTLALERAVAQGTGQHFALDLAKLDDAAEFVLGLAKRDYGGANGLDVDKIPPHSRWKHFETGGVDRIAPMLQSWGGHRKKTEIRWFRD